MLNEFQRKIRLFSITLKVIPNSLRIFARKEAFSTKKLRIMSQIVHRYHLRDEKIINVTSSRRYFFFTRAKFDANNGLFKESLVKYKGKRISQDVMFIVFSSLSERK